MTNNRFGAPRSYLFIPASRPAWLSKAGEMNADEIIVDLEDAVDHDAKVEVRDRLASVQLAQPLYARINAADTEYFEDDIEFCRTTDWVKGIVLPMVSCAHDVHRVLGRLADPKIVLALIETPQGILAAEEIALSGVSRLLFGTADYCASLASSPSDALFSYPRSRLVLASAVAGLPAPVDGPTLNIHDTDQLVADVRSARALGMGGKLCVHPSQIPLVIDTLGPTPEEMEWAKDVLVAAERHGGGVFALDGQMIDAPVIARARKLMEK